MRTKHRTPRDRSGGRWTYAAAGAAVGLSAWVGGRAAAPSDAWYASLDKPAWQPPTRVFPAVWTPLYASIAWSAGHAVNRARGGERRALVAGFGTNLALNAAWTWLFFARRSPAAGVWGALLLDASNLRLIRRVARSDRKAAAVLASYAGWCAFATALSASLTRRNR
ncbi:TspO protein [Streptomyces sp. NWU49]|uniref:TspO/MBR family protein n=1 Tax=Streptomyces sp. NWU49 TaxID=2201153 RepID=UPI000D67FCFF|nr:TspO/MBR family protein [Streptomyces sp. NWU49]PWJ03244.1 TspO protein [Streptomyces sp. NWU49]